MELTLQTPKYPNVAILVVVRMALASPYLWCDLALAHGGGCAENTEPKHSYFNHQNPAVDVTVTSFDSVSAGYAASDIVSWTAMIAKSVEGIVKTFGYPEMSSENEQRIPRMMIGNTQHTKRRTADESMVSMKQQQLK